MRRDRQAAPGQVLTFTDRYSVALDTFTTRAMSATVVPQDQPTANPGTGYPENKAMDI